MVDNRFTIFLTMRSHGSIIVNQITVAVAGWLVSWLEFNGTFSTKRLYRALQKSKVHIQTLISLAGTEGLPVSS